jgi:hypothetical protein
MGDIQGIGARFPGTSEPLKSLKHPLCAVLCFSWKPVLVALLGPSVHTCLIGTVPDAKLDLLHAA